MRKYIAFIITMVMLFSMAACSSQGQQTPDDGTTPSTESSTTLPQETEKEPVQPQKPFDPHDPDQPELIAVRNALASTIKEHGFPFEVDMTMVGMGSVNDSEDSFSFNLEYNDIVRTQILEITVYALDEKMQKGFEVYLNPDCEEAVLKEAVLCSILAIAPDLEIAQAENFYVEMTDGYNWEGRSNVIEVNGYNLHISEGALLRSGSGGYRGYPMLHVVAQSDLLPQHATSEYMSISSEMKSRDLAYFTGVVKSAYEDGYSYIMEVSSDDAVCGIYYMEDKFAGCFEAGQTYTFYGQFAGARDGFEYSIKLDGFEIGKVTPDTSNADDNESNSKISDADTSDIAVRFETDYIDGDRLHITVFTKNNSDEIFAGNIYVTFYSADGKDRLGSDTIIVDELLPGRESWADVIVDAYRGTPKLTVDYSEVSFTPMTEVIAEIDADATDKIKSSYYWNFDGVSWYKDITDIVAYKNGTCVVVLKDNPKEGGQFYASTIWSCGNDYGVDTVQVVDAKGTIIAVYGNGEMVSVSVSNGEIVSESNISTEVQGTETTESQTTSCSHSWNSGETTKKATCSETGIKTYTCLKCSEKKTESIPKTDHTYDAGKVSKNPTCTDVGKITYTCSACKAQYSEDVEKIAHTWDNGKVKNAATCTLEGTMEYQCTTCATTKTESIPLIAHSYTEKIISDKYLQTPASFTSGSIYSYSCSCGAKGNSTFTTDDRIEWISHSEIRNILGYGMGYNSKELYHRIDVGPGYPPTRYYIYNIPAEENMVVGEVYTGTCDGYTIRIKAEKAYNSSQFYDYLFFHYDDLVAAGII